MLIGEVKDAYAQDASAVAHLNENGQVDAVHLINSGFGYRVEPKVHISGGGGHGASAVSHINDDGEIMAIEIIHPGYSYVRAPNVEIAPAL